MKDNPNQYWLLRTNQFWKFMVFNILILLGIFAFFAMIMVINGVWSFNNFDDMELSFAAVFLINGSLIWLVQSIKCPECGYKPVWKIIKNSSINEWLGNFIRLERCPSCNK